MTANLSENAFVERLQKSRGKLFYFKHTIGSLHSQPQRPKIYGDN